MRGERNSGLQDNTEVISAGRWSASHAFKNHFKWGKSWLELSGKLMTDLNLCSKGSLENKSPQRNPLGYREWCKSEPEGGGTQGGGSRLYLLGQEENLWLLSPLSRPSPPETSQGRSPAGICPAEVMPAGNAACGSWSRDLLHPQLCLGPHPLIPAWILLDQPHFCLSIAIIGTGVTSNKCPFL